MGKRLPLRRMLLAAGVVASAYLAIELVTARVLTHAPAVPVAGHPSDRGLVFREVIFPSRWDRVALRGWFVPGVGEDGALTVRRTLIVVHGTRQNRSDPAVGLLELTEHLVRRGFAVLAFDMRGMGESPGAPLSLGHHEQRDVLGAVDFLRSGPLPFPELGRPSVVGGLGVSMGAATLLLAAAREPAIAAVVADSAYAEVVSLLRREIPRASHLPRFLTTGALLGARLLYGIDFWAVRPLEAVATIAPRPLLLIHGGADSYVPVAHHAALVAAGAANLEGWVVPGADHAQAFHVAGDAYVERVASFFTQALDPALPFRP